ncbi:MAG: cellulose synthase operon protein YhjQ [Gammaproteobacteria bacterium]|nr:MAG: cellulose synthase operon protein YhjQ [Gammaproteobacteria bacterium]
MNVLLVAGVKGGVGTTTVAANVATALSYQGKPVVALDLNHQNQLGFHLGLGYQECRGAISQLALGEPWHGACFQSRAGVYIIPYGKLDRGQSKRVRQGLDIDIGSDIASIDLPEDAWLIVDCSEQYIQSEHWDKLLEQATLLLMVTNTDASSLISLNRCMTEPGIINNQPQVSPQVRCLISRYQASNALQQDVYNSIQYQYGSRLFPVTIHDDAYIAESLASKQTVFEYAQHSQACRDFGLLGTWLVAGQCGAQQAVLH